MSKNISFIRNDKIIEKIFNYIKSQINQIKERGFSLLLWKVYLLLLIMSFAMVATGLILIMRPFVTIRLEKVSYIRISQLYTSLWYLINKNAGHHDKRTFDIFYSTDAFSPISNQQWVKMWKRVFPILHLEGLAKPLGDLAEFVFKLLRKVPNGELHRPTNGKLYPSYNVLQSFSEDSEPIFDFTLEEEEFGQKALQELGIAAGLPFICFHTRDSAYLDSVNPEKDWSYHDFRDTSIRNSIPAMEKFVAQERYNAIRMGVVAKEPLETTSPYIIDYAMNGKRTDFLDIYLGAKCRFFLSTDTGFTIIPEVFKRSCVLTNIVSIHTFPRWSRFGLVIFKKWYSTQEHRFLTFSEMLEFGYRDIQDIHQKKRGIEWIDNSPEEIYSVVNEMEERIKGTWEVTKEDEELQQRFWEIYGSLKTPKFFVGADFLRQNQNLLGSK